MLQRRSPSEFGERRSCQGLRRAHAYPNAVAYSIAHADPYGNAYAVANPYGNAYAVANPCRNPYPHSYANRNAYAYLHSQQLSNLLLERNRRPEPVKQRRLGQRLRRVDVRQGHAARNGEPELGLRRGYLFVGRRRY